MSLPQSSSAHLTKINEATELTIYGGELTAKALSQGISKVKAAFPALPPDFYILLINRLKEKGFSDERVKDSVNNVIDNCQYPTPTLANFLSFDKRVKLLTYRELVSKITEGEASFATYAKIKIKGEKYYIKKSDKEIFQIPDSI